MLYKSTLDNITLDEAKELIQVYQGLETKLKNTICTQDREIEALELVLQNKNDVMRDTKRHLDKIEELRKLENNLENKYKKFLLPPPTGSKENKKDDEGEWKYV